MSFSTKNCDRRKKCGESDIYLLLGLRDDWDMQKGFSAVLILIGVLILGLAVIGGFAIGRQSPAAKVQPQQSPSSVVVQVSPSPSIADETANWKTYTSNKFGIEFKYPNDWLVKETGSINVYPKSFNNKDERSVIEFGSVDNPNKLSLSDFQKEAYKNDRVGLPPLYYSPSDKPFEIGGATGFQHTPCGADGTQPLDCKMYSVPYGNKIFLLRTFIWEGIQNQEKVFDQIFSTYKFIATNDGIADSKIYKGDGFSFEYPTTMSIQKEFADEVIWKMQISEQGDFLNNLMYLQKQDKPFEELKIGTKISVRALGGDNSYKVFSYNISGLEENKTISLKDKEGKRFTFSCGVHCYYHILQFDAKGKYYQIIFNGAGGGLLNKFDQIVTSFKFN